MKVILDAKLDLREGAMWTQVDSYLNRFAGDGDSDDELQEGPGMMRSIGHQRLCRLHQQGPCTQICSEEELHCSQHLSCPLSPRQAFSTLLEER